MSEVLLAEFDDAEACERAVRGLYARGYSGLDVYMPFPAKNVEQALDLPKTPLPFWVLCGGLCGAGLAYLILWWTQHVDYPLDVASHPTHSVPAFIGITFETTVLFASLTAFFGLLWLCRLPKLYRPIFEVEAFRRASLDHFFLTLPLAGASEHDGRAALAELGARSVASVQAAS